MSNTPEQTAREIVESFNYEFDYVEPTWDGCIKSLEASIVYALTEERAPLEAVLRRILKCVKTPADCELTGMYYEAAFYKMAEWIEEIV